MLFKVKFAITVFSRTVSVTVKTHRYERAVELARLHRTEGARVYKGEIPTNLHTIRG